MRVLWIEGYALERSRAFQESTKVYEEIVQALPEESHLYWRIARNHLSIAQALPMADEEARLREFTLTERWGAKGAELDPDCAECVLYQFIGLASSARMHGLLSSASRASDLRRLLERALALGPTHVDGDWNYELANLYFAAGVFYKVVPDSRLAQWLIGVRGNPELSREYFRRAFEICDRRIDYRLALGSALLCQGDRAGDQDRIAEGLAILEPVPELPVHQHTDTIDQDHARILMTHPDRACDYSRDAWRLAEGR